MAGRKRKKVKKVEVLGEDEGKWRQKLQTREEKLRYLKTGERYWYGDGYGSEKRKKPA